MSSGSQEAAAHRPAKPNRSEDSGENDSFTMTAEAEDQADESEKEGKMSENNGTSKRAEPAGSNGDAQSGPAPSGPAPSKARVRTPCPYGTACYRYDTETHGVTGRIYSESFCFDVSFPSEAEERLS